MTDTEDRLVRRLRQFQADEPGFPPLFSAAATEIERLQREILRCDEACFDRDKEIAGLRRRVTVLEQFIYEELQDSGCQDDANEMIANEIIERLGEKPPSYGREGDIFTGASGAMQRYTGSRWVRVD